MHNLFSGTIHHTRHRFGVFRRGMLLCSKVQFVTLAIRSAFSEGDACAICSRVQFTAHAVRFAECAACTMHSWDSSPHTQSVLLSAPHARCVLMY
ncbi:hypothetical protein Hypma_000432 [Hypsizygus marmoreus]|uniref:Uncharacterized protein n=1 Tax=Hypsizygus marmoreus TaxID=39966 RepID=A0A369J8T1_HYPMA|nr:hypothetical protein Hypma_000432 [Hypsizygus marmoreus]